jgi:hypothetical protein
LLIKNWGWFFSFLFPSQINVLNLKKQKEI